LDDLHRPPGPAAPEGLLRSLLNLLRIAIPPYLIAVRQVVVVGCESRCAIDELADDTGTPGSWAAHRPLAVGSGSASSCERAVMALARHGTVH